MMNKVHSIWRIATILLIGFVFGVFVSLKYIAPPSQDINIGKIKVKGENNKIDNFVTIQKSDEMQKKKKIRLSRKQRKEADNS